MPQVPLLVGPGGQSLLAWQCRTAGRGFSPGQPRRGPQTRHPLWAPSPGHLSSAAATPNRFLLFGDGQRASSFSVSSTHDWLLTWVLSSEG